jgi:flotillin
MEPVLILGGAVVLGVVAFLLSLKSLIVICQPSEVVIFSGPGRRAGARVGYHAVRGGRGLRIPLLEVVDRLDLTNMSVEVAVRGAYSRDGVPLNVQGVANVKIDGAAPGLDHAVERLLGKSREDVVRIARETLEGNLRGVLAKLTPEQVNQDKDRFAQELIEEAEADLGRLGLLLDTLKIQTVADEVGYLDSIGRKQTAQLISRSRIAEAERQSEATVQAAENQRRTRSAQVDAAMLVAKAEADKRIVKATTSRPAEVARVRAGIEAQIARAEAELRVQAARIEQVRLQLEADVVEPARAYRTQKEANALAEVAVIRESGISTARGLSQLAERWREAGDAAREIFLLEKLRSLVGIMVGTVRHAQVDQLTMVGSGGEATLAGSVASLVEQLRAGGVDVPAALARLAGGGGAAAAPRPEIPAPSSEASAPRAEPSAPPVDGPAGKAPAPRAKR